MFCVRLKSARRIRGLTQAQLSRKAGLLQSNVARFEKGETLASIPNLFILARALDVSADFLIGLDDHLSRSGDVTPSEFAQVFAILVPDDRELVLRLIERLTAPQDDEPCLKNAASPTR